LHAALSVVLARSCRLNTIRSRAMVPNKILQRVFFVRVGNGAGTAFALESSGRQYLVTARHVVESLQIPGPLQVFRNNAWQATNVVSLWLSPSGADLAVIGLVQLLPVAGTVFVGPDTTFFLSERVFFLGFPFGMTMNVGAANNGYPVPFVKHGIIASFSQRIGNESRLLFLDGHNNNGFSGGPVVTVSADHRVGVHGVVSAYHFNNEPIMLNGQPSGLTYNANSGLVIAYDLKEALEHIATTPEGAAVF